MVAFYLLLIFQVQAKGGITSKVEENNILHSPWKWLGDFLINYPVVSTILSVLILMTLFVLIARCRKSWQKESDVSIILGSRSLNRKEKKSLLG
ncbi:unnamed protein product [Blepharisma stoltei]|uniref:ATP synthase F0 subunit 8 n=1 Tax=Blepharisma stoltei TaxID=1481888 RepID=A0AAU9JJW1_9CILI|nr:unnamed protein product [Blepharisma stoltei]